MPAFKETGTTYYYKVEYSDPAAGAFEGWFIHASHLSSGSIDADVNATLNRMFGGVPVKWLAEAGTLDPAEFTVT